MKSKRILPFEVKTTQLSQAVIYFWIPMILAIPIFVAADRKRLPYWIGLLVALVIFLAFFLASQNYIRKGESHEP
jgi:4-amino-4-deoxy-L-arabinose transferase-like glycosyltransferase